jgi:predicted ATPase/DNA-binding winged helix-turn-helix (wHTH) protein
MFDQADHVSHLSFGPFILRVRERQLERDGLALRLGSRAFDILVVLVERAGEIVTHRELLERVWPNTIVGEGSVRVHIVGLRKTLGETGNTGQYIANIPGRGYCFVAPIEASQRDSSLLISRKPAAAAGAAILPVCLKHMVGREGLVSELIGRLLSSRFVSIVAPGGTGKTTVAISVAHALLPELHGDVFFIDFGSLADSRLIANTIASTLGITVHSGDPASTLTALLAHRRLLLVLDNCEHLIEAIAPLAERLHLEVEGVHILATSREALRVEGEQVYRLPALETPSDLGSPTAEYALSFPAVQLFVERAAAGGVFDTLSDADAPIVARICGNLDGVPLAIELAAGRVNAYGLHGTATLLENRFRLDWQGRRTALSRHQTLNAMLDWSYRLLSATEQLILRRLSIFTGRFDFDAVRSVAVFGDCSDENLTEGLVGLVEKSMVARLLEAGAVVYRLLDTTRIYAFHKLSDEGETDLVAARHARHFTHVLDKINDETSGEKETVSFEIRPYLGNVRKALEWCFSESGDRALGISLAAAASGPFLEASLFGECSDWAERALTVLCDRDRGTAVEMTLQEALATGWMFTKGNREETCEALERGLAIADALRDNLAKSRMLHGLSTIAARLGEFKRSLEISKEVAALARSSGDRFGQIMGDFMEGISHHLIGSQRDAVRVCEASIVKASGLRYGGISWFSWISRIFGIASLARALWIQGFPERAEKVAHQVLAEGHEGDRPIKRCMSIIYSVHVFLWSGDYAKAAELIEEEIKHAAQHSLIPYHAVGLGLKGELLVKQGEAEAGIALLQQALEITTRERHVIQKASLQIALAEGLAMTGQYELALEVIDQAIKRVERSGNSFDLPEMMRIKGAILAKASGNHALEAEACLLNALHRARTQGDLSWELRIATTLSELMVVQGRSERARFMLSEIYSRFTEGHATIDLCQAEALLAHM